MIFLHDPSFVLNFFQNFDMREAIGGSGSYETECLTDAKTATREQMRKNVHFLYNLCDTKNILRIFESERRMLKC